MIPDHARANFQTLLRAAESGWNARTRQPASRAMSSVRSAATVATVYSRRSAIWRTAIPMTRTFRPTRAAKRLPEFYQTATSH